MRKDKRRVGGVRGVTTSELARETSEERRELLEREETDIGRRGRGGGYMSVLCGDGQVLKRRLAFAP